jgi:sensor histidine kinase regulating citrate/malate metabolism
VRDWGSGLKITNPKLLIRLMHSTKPGHQGIGLVSVDRVVRLHGGSVSFESPAEGGAVVSLTLPTAKEPRGATTARKS